MLNIKKVFYENKKPLNENSIILVTGGAGFIGSAVIWELNNLGVTQIDVCDKLGKGDKWLNLRPLKFRSYIELNELIKLMNTNVKLNYDYVFHLGACVNVIEQDMEYLINNNYKFTCDLANKVIDNGAKFIYASSASTYGEYSLPFSDDEEFLSTLRPLTKYGYSKHLIDINMYMKGGFENLGVVALKYSNVFGANEYHKDNMKSMILKNYEQIKEHNYATLYNSSNPLYEDGEQLRDFIYIKDVAKMTVFFATEKGMNLCGTYNIGSGHAMTGDDLTKIIFKYLNKPIDIRYIDMPQELLESYPYYTCLDIQKIKMAGYNEKMFTIEEGIKDYFKYLNCKNGYKRLGEENE